MPTRALWVAAAPCLPPPGCDGPPLAAQPADPAASKQRALICGASIGLFAVFVWILGPWGLITLGGPVVAFSVFLTYRRHFIAVGQGWWVERAGLFHTAAPTQFDHLVRLAEDTNGLVLHTSEATARLPLHLHGPVAHHIADQVLASSATVTPDAAGVLKGWRDSDVGSLTADASERAGSKRPLQRLYSAQLLLSGTALLVFGLIFSFYFGNQLRIRYDPHDVTVTATVDQVSEQCGRAGCHWWSVGHYTVADRRESNVTVANDRDSPDRAAQQLLVDPAHPRNVINRNETGQDWAFFFLMLVATFIGIVFLRWWASWHKKLRHQHT